MRAMMHCTMVRRLVMMIRAIALIVLRIGLTETGQCAHSEGKE